MDAALTVVPQLRELRPFISVGSYYYRHHRSDPLIDVFPVMENEVPFAADAEIDVQLHATSITHSSTSSLTPTEDVSKNAVSVRVNEETPLLPRTEREDDDVPQWSDPNAADSRSWWRRPSVRIICRSGL